MQQHDPERFVTTLFAPSARREALWALYAFNHELARAREVASNPLLALIRLQWWQEVIDGADRRHPVAEAVRGAIRAGALDRAVLGGLIDARRHEAEETVSAAVWIAYLHGSAGGLMRAAGQILGADDTMLAALGQRGAGCGAIGLWRNARVLGAAGRWVYGDEGDAAACRRVATELLGRPRRWPRAIIAAALPCVYARRALHRVSIERAGVGGQGAVWFAAARAVA